MAQTRPTGEQLRFRSENTGDHILDTYMEASEKGGRALFDLLDDIFESDGTFAADNFQFRFNETTNELEVRIGVFAGQDTGYKNITPFFAQRGTFSTNDDYNNLDVVVTSTKDVFVVHGLDKDSTLSFADEASFIASSNTQRIVDVSEARDWASKTDGQVNSTDYSAKAYAIGGTGVDDTIGSAKDWAIKTDATVDGTNFSAKYWATDTNVTTVSSNIGDITTVSDDISNVNIAAADIANINTTATNITDVNSVAAELGAGKDVTIVAANLESTDIIGIVALDIANVNTTAGSIGSVNTAASDIANINTVATSISDVNTVAPFVGAGNDITVVAAEINNNNLQTVADDIQNVIDVANDLNETVSEIEVVAGSIDNVDTVGDNIIDVNTLAGISTEVTTVSGINTDVATVSGINADVTTVAGISANVTTTANNDTNITTVAQNISDVGTVATDIANINTVAGEIGVGQDVTIVATDLAGTDTVGTVAGSITSVNTTASDITNVNTVATAITNVNTTATNIADVNTTAGNIANVNTVAGINANVTTVAGINSEVTTVANIDTDVSTVAGINANVTTVANNNANVTTVANNDADITTVANNDGNVTTVATNISDVTANADNIADINTVAANVTDITNFADVYFGPAGSDPSLRNDGTPLQTGDWYFNTTINKLAVYDGSSWLKFNDMAEQSSSSVNIDGGSIDGTSVGSGTPSTGDFTDFTASGTAEFTSTGAVVIPSGTQAQRPTPEAAMLRFNSDTSSFEGYDGSDWGEIGGAIGSGDLPAGSVLQVVYARPVFSETLFSGSAYQDTGLEASIIPISTSSKILVQWVIHARAGGANSNDGGTFRILRNGVSVTDSVPDFVTFTNTTSLNTVDAVDMFLDSPATTSTITYKVQVTNRSGASIRLHINGRADPSMVLMEIAG